MTSDQYVWLFIDLVLRCFNTGFGTEQFLMKTLCLCQLFWCILYYYQCNQLVNHCNGFNVMLWTDMKQIVFVYITKYKQMYSNSPYLVLNNKRLT